MANVDYKTLLQKEAEKRGWTPEQVNIFEQWRNNVGQMESNNDPSVKQKGGGPGRGKYQYELKQGGSGANETAVKRFEQYLKKNNISISALPKEDQLELLTPDPDFSKLSSETQDMIFLADKALAKDAALNDLVTGKIGQDEAWAKWHWKGKEEDVQSKMKQWDRNVASVQPTTPPPPKPVAKRPPQESLDALINQEYNNAVYPVKDTYRQEGFQLANPLLYPGYEP